MKLLFLEEENRILGIKYQDLAEEYKNLELERELLGDKRNTTEFGV